MEDFISCAVNVHGYKDGLSKCCVHRVFNSSRIKFKWWFCGWASLWLYSGNILEYMDFKKIFANMIKPCTCWQEENLQVRFRWNQSSKMP